MDMVVERFGIYMIRAGQQKSQRGTDTRPAVVLSPEEMNAHLDGVIVAPLAEGGPDYPTRVKVSGSRKSERVALDQMYTIDKGRAVRQVGKLAAADAARVAAVLQELFAL